MTVFHKVLHVFTYAMFFMALTMKADMINQDTDNIKSVIISYNSGIIQASKTDKSDFLKKFAVEKVVHKFHMWLKSWHDNNLFMDAKIENIVFKKVDVKAKNAFIITDEKWKYRYINIKTKKVIRPKISIEYSVKYTLLKKNDKWLIQNIYILSEK